MNRFVLLIIGLIYISHGTLACTVTEGADKGKVKLENGICGQVRFTGEPENFSTIADKLSALNIPALSVALIKSGQIEWSNTYQNEALSKENNLNCNSRFQAASLSKPVTMIAAVRMATAGKIDLDKDIQDYLKEYQLPAGEQTKDNPVTFRNILTHTSGITPGGYQGYQRDLAMPSDIEILEGKPGVNSVAIGVIAAPGKQLAYSGGAYTLAELALQDIYGTPFEAIMNKWVLEPAGMNQSDFTQPLPESKADIIALGHTQAGEVIEGGWHNYPEQAAAGLWTTASDMAKFLIELHKAYHSKSQLIAQADLKELLSQERDRLAYGFIVDRAENSIAITHFGGNTGYRTGMTIDLTTGNGLVYLINSDNGGALGNELLLSAAQVYGWNHFKQSEVKRSTVSTEILKGLVGNYKWNNQIDLPIKYHEETNQISLTFPNGDAYMLTPVEGDELNFIHAGSGVPVSFLRKDKFNSFKLYGQLAVKVK